MLTTGPDLIRVGNSPAYLNYTYIGTPSLPPASAGHAVQGCFHP